MHAHCSWCVLCLTPLCFHSHLEATERCIQFTTSHYIHHIATELNSYILVYIYCSEHLSNIIATNDLYISLQQLTLVTWWIIAYSQDSSSINCIHPNTPDLNLTVAARSWAYSNQIVAQVTTRSLMSTTMERMTRVEIFTLPILSPNVPLYFMGPINLSVQRSFGSMERSTGNSWIRQLTDSLWDEISHPKSNITFDESSCSSRA